MLMAEIYVHVYILQWAPLVIVSMIERLLWSTCNSAMRVCMDRGSPATIPHGKPRIHGPQCHIHNYMKLM